MVELTEEQEAAVVEIMSWEGDDFILAGAAGTGKTTIMREVADRMSAGRSGAVHLLAPTNQAARRLAKLTGYETLTIHKLIYGKPEELPNGSLVFPPPRLTEEYDPAATYVVDEASMVGKRLGEDLRSIVSGLIVWVGDQEQLKPVEETPYVDLLRANFTLGTVHRQAKGSKTLAIATEVRAFSASAPPPPRQASLWALTQRHGVSMMASGSVTAAAQRLLHLHQTPDAQSSVILAWRNAVRRATNAEYRRICGASTPLHPGERLVVQNNHYSEGYLNGDVVRVRQVEWRDTPPWLADLLGRRMATFYVEGDEKPLYTTDWLLHGTPGSLEEKDKIPGVSYPPGLARRDYVQAIAMARDRAKTMYGSEQATQEQLDNLEKINRGLSRMLYLDYAYCMTVHRFQGSQAHTVVLVWEQEWMWTGKKAPPDRRDDTRRWLYTALTRAEKDVFVVQL